VALKASAEPVPASEPPPATAPPGRALAPRRPLRLLVAEDNPVNRELITAVLRNLGHSVEVVANGRQTLAALDRGTFDAVLMDVQMPGLDGIETTREIRRRESEHPSVPVGNGRHHLPIIALTAHAMKGDREQCVAAGMDDYLAKPVRRPDLLAALDRLEPGAGAADPVAAAPAVSPFHPEGLLAELNGDQAAMRRLIALFLESTPPLLDQMRAALDSGDRGSLGSAAHILKGSLMQFSEEPARALATELERVASSGEWLPARALVAELETEIARFSAELRQFVSPGNVVA
jgi:CheY-like chemotaxis protein